MSTVVSEDKAMAINLKRLEKATINYTDRRRIRLRDCKVTIADQSPDKFRIQLHLDTDCIHLEEGQAIVFEAFYRALYERFELHQSKSVNEFYLDSFPTDATPSFRLKLVSTEKELAGRIVSATTFFKATKSDDEQESDTAFFKYDISNELGGRIWWIDWEDRQNPVIKINKQYEEKFQLKSDNNAQAYIFPAIVREILVGVSLGVQIEGWESIDQIDDRSTAARWLRFCDQRLGVVAPDGDDWMDPQAWTEFVDCVVKRFCDKKWDKHKTLFQKLVGS